MQYLLLRCSDSRFSASKQADRSSQEPKVTKMCVSILPSVIRKVFVKVPLTVLERTFSTGK